MFSIATIEVFSKTVLPNFIEKILEEYLEKMNSLDKLFKGKCNFIKM